MAFLTSITFHQKAYNRGKYLCKTTFRKELQLLSQINLPVPVQLVLHWVRGVDRSNGSPHRKGGSPSLQPASPPPDHVSSRKFRPVEGSPGQVRCSALPSQTALTEKAGCGQYSHWCWASWSDWTARSETGSHWITSSWKEVAGEVKLVQNLEIALWAILLGLQQL